MFAGYFYALGKEQMNPKIEKVRDDIKRTEAKIRELDEYLKTLRIREKQLCDEELIKVMRSMAGRDGDVIAMLDAFVNAQGTEESISTKEECTTSNKSSSYRKSYDTAADIDNTDADKNNEIKEDEDEE